MTILYFITSPELGGAQSNVLHLLRGTTERFDEAGTPWKVHLVVGREGPLCEAAREMGVVVHIMRHLQREIAPVTDIKATTEFVALLQSIQPDLIHAHSSKAGIVGRLAARYCRVPIVFTAHGWGWFNPGTPVTKRFIAWLMERSVAGLAQRIICVSEYDRKLARKLGIGRARRCPRVVTVHNGIPAAGQPTSDPEREPVKFIMVARFTEPKDHASVIRALAQLSDETMLDFVGEGPHMDDCQSLARELGVEQRVRFLGDRQDVPQLLADAQVFILSTYYEGLPVSILEAMCTRLPVIASRVNGVPEEVVDGKTGLLVPAKDADALAGAMKTLIEQPFLRLEMGNAGFDRLERMFTRDLMLSRTFELYDELIGFYSKG